MKRNASENASASGRRHRENVSFRICISFDLANHCSNYEIPAKYHNQWLKKSSCKLRPGHQDAFEADEYKQPQCIFSKDSC
jgi:hypothetical protein